MSNILLSTIISIDGNIGSGKSTLLDNLKKHYENSSSQRKIIFVDEPVKEWESITDENGTTMLEKFYGDQEKYSFPFQMMAFISRLNALKKTADENPGCIIISERSLYTDKMVFAKMLFDTGKIELVNYKIYLKWFESFSEEFPIDKVIYVKTTPEICEFRMKMRSRTGESSVSLEYLTDCDLYHMNMLDTNSKDCICYNQLVLDGNIDIHEDVNIVKKWITQIGEFIRNG
jgi:deoxyadenosine/deoxycytidine kinase